VNRLCGVAESRGDRLKRSVPSAALTQEDQRRRRKRRGRDCPFRTTWAATQAGVAMSALLDQQSSGPATPKTRIVAEALVGYVAAGSTNAIVGERQSAQRATRTTQAHP
jgi:hypothetical protein